MRSPAFRLIYFLALTVFCLGSDSGSNKYVIDYPGKATIDVGTSYTFRFGLKPAETAAFHANLRRLRDLLIAQPMFHPALGVEVSGYIRADHGGQVVKTAPVRGLGHVIYYPYVFYSKTQQPGKMIASPWEMVIHINDPVGSLHANGKLFLEPKQAGQLYGFPVYRGADSEFIVLSSTGKPAWIPVTREEYIQLSIRDIEKELAEFKKEQSGVDQEALARLSPQDRATVEKALGNSGGISIIKQRLQRHQEVLARMSPQERTAWAQNGDPGNGDYLGPQLAPIGKQGIGPPYVKANPDWFDPLRPRSDLQIITIEFDYAGALDPEHPEIRNEYGEIAGLRLWETLYKSDWKAISGVLIK
jgi:hypothetical protein